ncbi:MAG: carbamoyltransferase HypF [Candidatus Binatia bacterium]
MSERRHITVSGIVQGVGFRPFVHGLALKNGLAGFVLNHTAGVTIELEGEQPALNNFLTVLTEAPPPLARIESIDCSIVPPRGESEFKITSSHGDEQRSVLISPDTPTCENCLEELFGASDRRYRYPFINCTHCGPRFTIIKDVPYDRERTTMARFTMCANCAEEYHDPANRRFHAQANACPRCGPRVRLLDSQGRQSADSDAVFGAAQLLREGAILAVKGLGGYHLACNALDHDAVRRLRARKHREDKPFALMACDLRAVRELCVVAPEDEMLLSSLARPIVLLRKHENISIGAAVAPGQRRIGLMLPYTPLHHLLLADADMPLVMTSGNLSEEPIAYRDDDALSRLGQIADYFLVHDREIHTRCDDSVVRTIDRRALIIRRARGYAPQPISLRVPFVQPVLACGAHLKNTFCLAKDRHAFLSHHIGDLENYETLDSFTQGIEHFKNLFAIEPRAVAHDLHPDYLSSKYAMAVSGVPKIGVQHHHAHIASCMAEHGLAGPVIGVAFDGLGYGEDGAIWGGEFLIADLSRYERRGHLRNVPMAGGDRAIREPWRMALSYLRDTFGKDPLSLALPGWQNIGAKKIDLVTAMIERGLNTVQTSSCGRLFDAVAAILALRHEANYEGQAAVELEAIATDGSAENYDFDVGATRPAKIDMRPAIARIVREIRMKVPVSVIAAKFHNTIVAVITRMCRRLRDSDGLKQVCLSGGTFQNSYLLERVLPALRESGFEVYINRQVPPNDGGIALGQAAVANAVMAGGR